MPSASGKFPAPGGSDLQPRLETGRREAIGVRHQVRQAQGHHRRLEQANASYPTADRPDPEGEMEHSAADQLPGLPPMKRVFQHPPESGEGRQYWRGLDELKSTPQFQSW